MRGLKSYKVYKRGRREYTVPILELKQYRYKKVVSGEMTEEYYYNNPITYGYQGRKMPGVGVEAREYEGKSDYAIKRARDNIRRLVMANCNKYSKFFTLTYKENMIDYKKFQYDWKLFNQNMRNNGTSLKYLMIIEQQKRGAIHAHIIVFNQERIPWQKLKKHWPHGSIDIHTIRKVKNLGAYVCKYLQKDLAETPLLNGKNIKLYQTSRGLNKPITQVEEFRLMEKLDKNQKMLISARYEIKDISGKLINIVNYRQKKG